MPLPYVYTPTLSAPKTSTVHLYTPITTWHRPPMLSHLTLSPVKHMGLQYLGQGLVT